MLHISGNLTIGNMRSNNAIQIGGHRSAELESAPVSTPTPDSVDEVANEHSVAVEQQGAATIGGSKRQRQAKQRRLSGAKRKKPSLEVYCGDGSVLGNSSSNDIDISYSDSSTCTAGSVSSSSSDEQKEK